MEVEIAALRNDMSRVERTLERTRVDSRARTLVDQLLCYLVGLANAGGRQRGTSVAPLIGTSEASLFARVCPCRTSTIAVVGDTVDLLDNCRSSEYLVPQSSSAQVASVSLELSATTHEGPLDVGGRMPRRSRSAQGGRVSPCLLERVLMTDQRKNGLTC